MGRVDSSGARRSDDDPEVFKKRYRTYITQTMPIIHRFEEKGLVRRLSAVQGPEEASRVHSQHCYRRQIGTYLMCTMRSHAII